MYSNLRPNFCCKNGQPNLKPAKSNFVKFQGSVKSEQNQNPRCQDAPHCAPCHVANVLKSHLAWCFLHGREFPRQKDVLIYNFYMVCFLVAKRSWSELTFLYTLRLKMVLGKWHHIWIAATCSPKSESPEIAECMTGCGFKASQIWTKTSSTKHPDIRALSNFLLKHESKQIVSNMTLQKRRHCRLSWKLLSSLYTNLENLCLVMCSYFETYCFGWPQTQQQWNYCTCGSNKLIFFSRSWEIHPIDRSQQKVWQWSAFKRINKLKLVHLIESVLNGRYASSISWKADWYIYIYISLYLSMLTIHIYIYTHFSPPGGHPLM